jgi:hypothetical protein
LRCIGAYRLRTSAIHNGFDTAVVDFLDYAIDNDLTDEIIDRYIDKNTVVGFSTTWFMKDAHEFYYTKWSFLSNIDYQQPHKKKFIQKSQFNIELFPSKSKDKWRSFLEKVKAKSKLVVFGGANIEYFLKPEYEHIIDYAVVGYADDVIIDILRYANGINLALPYQVIKNIKIIYSNNKFSMESIGTEFLEEDYIQPDEALPIEVSRGCRFKCKFCAFPLNGRKKNDYIRSHECLRNELMQNYEKFGVTQYRFLCDTYNESLDKLEFMHHIISSLPFSIEFEAFIRHDLLTIEQVKYLKHSGLTSAVLGIETLNKKSGEVIGKGMHPDETINRVELLRKEIPHCHISTGIIVGLPEDSVDNVEWLFQMVKRTDLFDRINAVDLQIRHKSSLTALSDIEENCERYGYTKNPDDTAGGPLGWINKHGMTRLEARQIAYRARALFMSVIDLKNIRLPYTCPIDKTFLFSDKETVPKKIQLYTNRYKKRYFNKLLS